MRLDLCVLFVFCHPAGNFFGPENTRLGQFTVLAAQLIGDKKQKLLPFFRRQCFHGSFNFLKFAHMVRLSFATTVDNREKSTQTPLSHFNRLDQSLNRMFPRLDRRFQT